MASSSRPLTLFSDLNDPISSAGPSAPTPTLPVIPLPNLPMMSIEQIMAAQSDIEANHFTLTSCMEMVMAVTKLAHRLQNRTSELHQVNAQLSLLQHMYKDARAEIGTLTAKNKELKQKTTSMARFRATSFLAFDSQRGVVTLNESMGAGASRVTQGDKKKNKTMEEARYSEPAYTHQTKSLQPEQAFRKRAYGLRFVAPNFAEVISELPRLSPKISESEISG
ncbi:hypothetical protein HYC85_028604 [Camellia sinensis]|uniref:Uncharacterized protein n=1 Tax=Camellia sinensis TaxID=4442 RepID=A0A7J7FVM2_CAMSI|nr:hypothetical protein HYC85_028604 [Camellia sinensis]